jgi:uncharacterized membrane protein
MADDNPSSSELLREISERLKYLESVVSDQVRRLYAIEQKLGIAYRVPQQDAANREDKPLVREPQRPEPALPVKPLPKPPAVESVAAPIEPRKPEPVPPKEVPQVPRASEVIPPAGKVPEPRPRPVSQTSSPVPPPTREKVDLESRIGGRWFNWIGVLAICIGVGFFLKLAIDRAWIGQAGRVAIGVALGVAFLAGGEKLRKRYASYAYGLTGGGILLLYLTFFAAYNSYQLIPQLVAFVLMALVTATASLLAARYNALSIAILGLIGGFMTPILLSTGKDNELGLFSYITLLDLGVLALAYSKHWRALNYLAFGATVAIAAGWMWTHWSPEKLWLTIAFFSLFFVIFALLAVLYNVVKRQPTRWLDLALVFINALLYFGTSYELLEDDYHKYLGIFAVMVAGFYLLLGYFTWRRDREDRLLVLTFLGLAFLFLVLAVPIQLDQHWVTMAWAIEGAIMTWIGLKVNDRTSRYAALIVFVIAISHWAMIDLQEFAFKSPEIFAPLFNRRAASSAVLVASLALAAWFYKRNGENVDGEERSMFRSLYLLAANALAVVLLSLDVNDYFEQARVTSDGTSGTMTQINNNRHVVLSSLWSLYGGAALMVGIVRGITALRLGALGLLGLAVCKVLLIDLSYYDAQFHTTFFNQTFAAFAVLITALAGGAWFYARSKQVEHEEKSVLVPLLIAAANVLAIVALSAEASGHFERAKAAAETTATIGGLENTRQFALSAVWTLYATASLIIGVARKKKALRVGALVLLALAAIKVLTVDLLYFSASWHTTLFNQSFAAFALLIAALATCAWFYSRSKDIGDKERSVIFPLLIGVANVLAVIGLSAEVVGHFERAKVLISDGPASGNEFARLSNSQLFWLSILWSVYGGAALVAGIKRSLTSLRWGALGLLAIAIAKVLVLDLRYYDAEFHSLIFNQTFGAFAFVIAALASGVWFYARSEEARAKDGDALVPVIIAIANILAIIGLSAEASGYFKAQMETGGVLGETFRDLKFARQLSLSVVWTIYGGAMLTVGILRSNRLLRWMALILLGMTIVKVFLVDLASLDTIYRIISFIVLGAILLVVSFLYQRFRQRWMEGAEAPDQAAGD